MRPRVIDEGLIWWGAAVEVNKALVVVHVHGPCTRVLQYNLLSPRQAPDVGRLVEEGCFIPLISTCARDPLVRYVAVESGITLRSSTGVLATAGAPIPPVVVLTAVADREAPLTG